MSSPLRLLLVEDNPGDARLIREMLAETESFAVEVVCVDSLLAALETLAHSSIDVVLTDLSLPDSQGLEAFRAIQSHAPETPIVVITGLDDERAAVDAVQSGAQDYLVKGSLTADALLRALLYAVIRQGRSSEEVKPKSERGAFLGVLSAKGGVGATTLACHMALELKNGSNEEVLLADLDASSTSAGLLLGVNSSHTILEAARSLHRLDISLWKGVVCHTTSGIDLAQSPGATRFGEEVNGERLRHVLRFVRPFYRWIVVDLGKLDATSMTVLSEIKEIFLVGTGELPALHNTVRVLKKLLELGFSRDRVHVVINRVSKTMPMSSRDLEKAIGYPIYALIPDYSAELNEAYGEGRYLDRNSHLHRHAAHLVTRDIGTAEPPRSGIKRLLLSWT